MAGTQVSHKRTRCDLCFRQLHKIYFQISVNSVVGRCVLTPRCSNVRCTNGVLMACITGEADTLHPENVPICYHRSIIGRKGKVEVTRRQLSSVSEGHIQPRSIATSLTGMIPFWILVLLVWKRGVLLNLFRLLAYCPVHSVEAVKSKERKALECVPAM